MDKKYNVTTRYLENGNMVFSYKRTKYRDTVMSILIPLMVVIIFCVYEYASIGSVYILILGIPILICLSYRWLRKTEKNNESVERVTAYKLLAPIIENYIKSQANISLIKQEYVIKIGEDDEIKERYVMVLLSDGRELRYKIQTKVYDETIVLEINSRSEIIK